jgi:hypothetical protein
VFGEGAISGDQVGEADGVVRVLAVQVGEPSPSRSTALDSTFNCPSPRHVNTAPSTQIG